MNFFVIELIIIEIRLFQLLTDAVNSYCLIILTIAITITNIYNTVWDFFNTF